MGYGWPVLGEFHIDREDKAGDEAPSKHRLRFDGRIARVNWTGTILPAIESCHVTYRISAHYPLWTELAGRGPNPL